MDLDEDNVESAMRDHADDDAGTMLGKWLRHARGKRSQADVAARVGMEQGQWSNWETGKRKRPKPQQIQAFARALGVPVSTVALAYAGIWPPDVETHDTDSAMVLERVRILDLPPDLDDDEVLMLKHLYRGIRAYKAEAEALESARVSPGEIAGRRA